MQLTEEVRVAATALGNGCRDDLVEAMRANGWTIDVVGGIEQLASLASSGAHHLAIAVCPEPDDLPRKAVRTLMGLQTDVSVVFLVPPNCDAPRCAPLIGATSDQVHRLNSPVAELMQALRYEIQSVLSDQPEYTVVCVDDDVEFLTSLEALLAARLKKTLPRFALNIEAYADPREAIEEIAAASAPPAVIVSDQLMPEINGIDLLRRVKDLCPETRCVLLTGHAALDSAVTAINAHVLDKYCFKPVDDPVDFANNVRHLLLEHHLHKRAETQRNHTMLQFEFIRTISATRDVDAAIGVTLGFIREHLRPRRALIALAGDEGYTVRGGFGLGEDLQIGANVERHAMIEQVLRRRRPVIVGPRRPAPDDAENASPTPTHAAMAIPLIWQDAVPGAILMAGRDRDETFGRGERMLVSFVADVTAMTVSGFEDRRALEDVYLGTMATLMETVEAKDIYTRGHTDRVTELAGALARAVGIKGEQLEEIKRAAALHDIGKIALPDRIILKPGPLTIDERAMLQEHSERAEKILQHLKFLDSVRIIVRAHHEKYDGSGYPDGLRGEEAPLGARILAIVDAFDAMTSVRPYRQAMSTWDALEEIENNSGKQFDPKLSAVFLDIVRKGECPLPGSTAEGEEVLKGQGRSGS